MCYFCLFLTLCFYYYKQFSLFKRRWGIIRQKEIILGWAFFFLLLLLPAFSISEKKTVRCHRTKRDNIVQCVTYFYFFFFCVYYYQKVFLFKTRWGITRWKQIILGCALLFFFFCLSASTVIIFFLFKRNWEA